MNSWTFSSFPFGRRCSLAVNCGALLTVLMAHPVLVFAETLTWSGAVNRDWDNVTANWTGSRPNFQPDDDAVFGTSGAGLVFIGHEGVAADVRPRAILIDSDADYVFAEATS